LAMTIEVPIAPTIKAIIRVLNNFLTEISPETGKWECYVKLTNIKCISLLFYNICHFSI
jgi:hypothetical protein